MNIHPTAILDPRAELGTDVQVGAYSIIDAYVTIGAHTVIGPHVHITGYSTLGEDCVVHTGAVLGEPPQDRKYSRERSFLIIGNRNIIREFVTIHRGTEGGGRVTRIGDGNLLMAYVHVAHDVDVGSHTVLANGVTLGGHVTVGDYVTIGAFSGVHQFCRVGRQAIIGGYSVVTQDILPFSNSTTPRDVKCFGENRVGLERRGFAPETVEHLHTAFRLLTRGGLNTSQAIERILAEVPPTDEVDELIAFIRASARGVIK